MSRLSKLYRFLQGTGILRQISATQISLFILLASLLKDDILLAQPCDISVDEAPLALPPTITEFLAQATKIPVDSIPRCWIALRHDVWHTAPITVIPGEVENLFREYGWHRGITALKLYPPTHYCTNSECTNCHVTPLKRESQRQIILYTLANGAQPGWHIHLTCKACKTAYHNNYSVKDGIRTYYQGIPHFLQVGEHQFIEDRVGEMWRSMMLLGWFSATNCGQMYLQVLGARDDALPERWKIGKKLDTAQVWDSFVLLALLDDCRRRQHDGRLGEAQSWTCWYRE